MRLPCEFGYAFAQVKKKLYLCGPVSPRGGKMVSE